MYFIRKNFAFCAQSNNEATFDEFYKSDNGDNPIYNKETLDQIIGESVTFDEINELVTSK